MDYKRSYQSDSKYSCTMIRERIRQFREASLQPSAQDLQLVHEILSEPTLSLFLEQHPRDQRHGARTAQWLITNGQKNPELPTSPHQCDHTTSLRALCVWTLCTQRPNLNVNNLSQEKTSRSGNSGWRNSATPRSPNCLMVINTPNLPVEARLSSQLLALSAHRFLVDFSS